MTSIVRSLIASTVPLTAADLLAAMRNRSEVPAEEGFASCYLETAHRATMRALLDGAGHANAPMNVRFLKVSGEQRVMRALPCPEVDPTNQFYTVVDLELTEEAGRTIFRRVNLDTVVSALVEFRAAALAG